MARPGGFVLVTERNLIRRPALRTLFFFFFLNTHKKWCFNCFHLAATPRKACPTEDGVRGEGGGEGW